MRGVWAVTMAANPIPIHLLTMMIGGMKLDYSSISKLLRDLNIKKGNRKIMVNEEE